jgi:anti-sigma regulatory factor (Ser/Thr protein kinase)
VKTGVQSIAKTLKTLDSGFRRNDVKKNRTDFFTPSPSEGGGGVGVMFLKKFMQRLGFLKIKK